MLDADIDQMVQTLNLKTKAGREALIVMIENLQLLDKKQQDYGAKNISDFGTLGVVIRMNDKFRRLQTLFATQKRKPRNESIRDSFRDIANYAEIALLLDSGKWPKE